MAADFSIVHDKGSVTFVLNKPLLSKDKVVETKSLKVQCFDPDLIDRIFHYQEVFSKHKGQSSREK